MNEEMRFLTPAEITTLADAIDERYRAAVLLSAYGGLRVGELWGLRAGRVDILRSRVDVAEILVEVSGQLYFGPPKTKAGRRAVPVPRVVTDALSDHLRTYPAGPTDLVFRTREGDSTRLANWRHRVWEPAIIKAKLGRLRPHDLRHTAVALWKMSNVAVFASFHTVRDEVPPGDMDLSGNAAVRSSRDEDLVGVGIHHP
jgi:integrase